MARIPEAPEQEVSEESYDHAPKLTQADAAGPDSTPHEVATPESAEASARIKLGAPFPNVKDSEVMDPSDPNMYNKYGHPRLDPEAARNLAKAPGVREAEEDLARHQRIAKDARADGGIESPEETADGFDAAVKRMNVVEEAQDDAIKQGMVDRAEARHEARPWYRKLADRLRGKDGDQGQEQPQEQQARDAQDQTGDAVAQQSTVEVRKNGILPTRSVVEVPADGSDEKTRFSGLWKKETAEDLAQGLRDKIASGETNDDAEYLGKKE